MSDCNLIPQYFMVCEGLMVTEMMVVVINGDRRDDSDNSDDHVDGRRW